MSAEMNVSAATAIISKTPCAAPFVWLLDQLRADRPGALLTVTSVTGGAPRPMGTQMAVVAGDRFTGHLSGGCVEPAIASEVEPLIARGESRILKFGNGSPFLDIRFPCGGGIDVLVSVGLSQDSLESILDRFGRRQVFTLAFDTSTGTCTIAEAVRPTGWIGTTFYRTYLPQTRLSIAGRGPEFESVVRLASAMDYVLDITTPDAESARRLRPLAHTSHHLTSIPQHFHASSDPWTASILLFHDRDWEEPILIDSLAGQQFYIGALGSRRTYEARRKRLTALGFDDTQIDRITGPIGLIPQARDPATLALSVLAEIALRRREVDKRFEQNCHD